MEDPNDIEAGLDRLEAEAEQAESISPNDIEQCEQPDTTTPAISTGDAMSLLVKSVCDVVAGRRGEHWRLKADEATAVGEAYGTLLDAWIPLDKLGPAVTAVMISAVVFGPRVAMDRQHKRKAKVVNETKQDGSGDRNNAGSGHQDGASGNEAAD